MAELKLRNCPFCGDKQHLAHVELSNGLHYVECKRCGAAPHRLGAWNRETAVKYWNSVNRWIPVEDALPEKGKCVLCAFRANIMCVLKWTGTDWYENPSHCYMSGFVTHWMNLPEPPEKE